MILQSSWYIYTFLQKYVHAQKITATINLTASDISINLPEQWSRLWWKTSELGLSNSAYSKASNVDALTRYKLIVAAM